LDRQTTLAATATAAGVGVHSGSHARVALRPAGTQTGVVFVRRDLAGDNLIPAHAAQVTDTRLGVTIANGAGASVAVVEHLLSALSGLGVDNVIVEIDGPEVPILDGSSAAWVALIQEAGVRTLNAPRRVIEILKPIAVVDGQAQARLEPAGRFELDVAIDFASAAIGAQRAHVAPTPETFADDVGFARTFGFAHEVAQLQAMGLARGGSLENAIVVDGDAVVNPEGLRADDEFVRHKILDAIGDLSLAGAPIKGRFVGKRSGHGAHVKLVRALLADRSAWRWTVTTADEPVLAAAGL
jgi:UDP-3-O-[3-hydroxymyristoyl] N-acetylglucosamine deacetylase